MENKMAGGVVTRREFLKGSSMGLLALGLGLSSGLENTAAAEQAQKALEKELNQEKKPEQPKVRIDFIFSPHRTAKDMEKLEERIKGADIVVLECRAWEQEDLELWQNLSNGKITPSQAFEERGMSMDDPDDAHWFEIYNAIHGSHKHIESIDLPLKNPLNKEFESYSAKPNNFYAQGFKNAMTLKREEREKYARLQLKREAFMLARLKNLIEEQSQAKKGPELKIAISIGAAHTGLWHKVKKQGLETRAKFSQLPFVYWHNDELVRKYFFGKKFDDKTLAHALLEDALSDYLGWPPAEDTEKGLRFLRKLVSNFSIQEIQSIFEELKGKTSDKRIDMLVEKLRAKNVTWPINEEGVDAFLSKHKVGKKEKKKDKIVK